MLDLILKNGSVLDGSGSAARRMDVGVKDGKIAALGDLPAEQARQTLDCSGKTVTPGFLDIHRHADLAALRDDFGELELMQGLTTIVNGNCGLSAAPFGRTHREQILGYLAPIIGTAQPDLPTQSMHAYLSALEKKGVPINVGMLIGAGVLRADAAGYSAEPLQNAQYQAIHQSVQRALADGAYGVSLGLGYAPECFYSTAELIRSLEPLRGGNIPITVHMREEGNKVDRSVEEMLTVARELHCPLHISHLKAMGKYNWQKKIPKCLNLLRDALQEGMDVRWDVYPYTAGSTQLLHILPVDFLEGGTDAVCKRLMDDAERKRLSERLKTGEDFENIARLVGWDNIVMSTLSLPENVQYAGMTIAQIAALRGQEPDACVFDLLAQERCAITMIDFITCEEDIAMIMQSSQVNLISDSTYPTEGKPHPRLYGTFSRVIEKYVLREHILTLEDAVHKMTQAAARSLGIEGKGVLQVGADADINVFVPEAIHENTTYTAPSQLSSGMDYIFVNGQAAVWQGKRTNSVSGHVLRRV